VETCSIVNSLRAKTFTVFHQAGGKTLGDVCLRLLSQQRATWADCAVGYDLLNSIEERSIDCNGFSVVVQHNPGRTASTEALVGEKDIAGRPCFLCANKLPADQRMVWYRREYMILCNPMPVFPAHFTVALSRHEPQTINDHASMLLRLISDLGDGWTVFYNGPRCGASAPDHLHFQVVTGGRTPIEEEISKKDRWETVAGTDVPVFRGRGLGREVVLMEAVDAGQLHRVLECYLKAFSKVTSSPGTVAFEPMINIAGVCRNKVTYLVVFPRSAHRPSVFFLRGDERIVVSPAVAEMSGVMVTPVKKDYARLTADIIRRIYGEVTLDQNTADRVAEEFVGCLSC